MNTGQMAVPHRLPVQPAPAWFTRSAMPSIGIAIGSIWGAVLVASLLLAVAGDRFENHEQLAVVAMADSVWATVATALVLLAGSVTPRTEAGAWPVLAP